MTPIDPPTAPSGTRLVLEAVSRASLAAVPIAGGAAVELFQAVTTRGRAERMDRWIQDVCDELERLRVSINTLHQSPGFLDAIGPAARAAVETANAEKAEALRNAVLNSTINPDVAADRNAILLSILVGLTPTHLRLLQLFNDPPAWFAERSLPLPNVSFGSQLGIIEKAIPDLAADPVLLRRAAADLNQEGLSTISLQTNMSGGGLLEPRTTILGDALLRFITAPQRDSGSG